VSKGKPERKGNQAKKMDLVERDERPPHPGLPQGKGELSADSWSIGRRNLPDEYPQN
jgi:hypothetical protein